MDNAYAAIGNLTQEKEFPRIYSDYKEEFDKMFFLNICKFYLSPQLGFQCEDELLNSGLETVGIYILENTRKNLNFFLQRKEESDVVREILQSKEILSLGNI